jgi:anti-sigma28 factor (negative regulator of flagellin synthesis)
MDKKGTKHPHSRQEQAEAVEGSESRKAKIERLRAEIAAGRYVVPAAEVADRLIERARLARKKADECDSKAPADPE